MRDPIFYLRVFLQTLIYLFEKAKIIFESQGTIYFLLSDEDAEALIERNGNFIYGELNAKAKAI